MALPIPTNAEKQEIEKLVTADQLPVPTAADLVPADELPVPGMGTADSLPVPTAEEKSAVDLEIENRSMFDKPVLGAEYTTDDEIAQLAAKHGVDPKRLRELAPYFGARMDGAGYFSGDEMARAAGGVGSVFLGAPQKIYKSVYNDDPAMERALDDVQALAGGRTSYLANTGEIAAPLGVPAKFLKGATAVARVAKNALAGAGTGAVAGLSASRQDEEGAGTGIGTALGLALGAGVGGLITALERRAVNRVTSRAATGEPVIGTTAVDPSASAVPATVDTPKIQYLKNNQAQIQENIDKALQERAASERVIREAVLDAERKLTPDEAAVITREQYTPDEITRLTNPATEEGQAVLGLAKKRGSTPEEVLARNVVEDRLFQLSKDVSGEQAMRSTVQARRNIESYASGQGGTRAVAEAYDNVVAERLGTEYLKRESIKSKAPLSKTASVAMDGVSDAQFVIRSADEKFGTRALPVHNRMNTAHNRYTYAIHEVGEDYSKIFDSLKKSVGNSAARDEKSYRKIVEAIENPALRAGLTDVERRAAEDISKFFEKHLERVNTMAGDDVTPLSIGKLENYFPKMTLPPEKLVPAMQAQMRKVLVDAQQLTGKPIRDLSQLNDLQLEELAVKSDNYKELVQGLAVFDEKIRKVRTGKGVSDSFRDAITPGGGAFQRMETAANAAEQRSGELPDYMRDFQPFRVMNRWGQNTYRHVYMRKPIADLITQSKLIEKAGGEVESKYINRLLGDLTGIRPISGGRLLRDATTGLNDSVDKLVEKAGGPDTRLGKLAGLLKSFPLMLDDMNAQIYPNALGASPRALLNNMWQVWVKTAPELGGAYGYSALSRGIITTMGKWGKQTERLKKLGLAPSDFTRKHRSAVEEGIQQAYIYKVPAYIVRKIGDLSLLLYQKTDTLNRNITLSVADHMVHDLVNKKSASAQKALKRFPTSIQREFQSALTSGNQDEAARVIAEYLNASTQFNYNRASMAEFGRFMGSAFSTFTKWPLATAGDIRGEIVDKGVLRAAPRIAEKYMVSWVALATMQQLLIGDPEEMSDTQKKLLGKQGLATAAPIGSAKALASGDMFRAPFVDAIYTGIVIPALSNDPYDGDRINSPVVRGLAAFTQTYGPGAVVARVLTDDLPTFMDSTQKLLDGSDAQGRRPEGRNFFERTLDGLDRVTK